MKISEATFNELKETFDKAVEEAFGAGVKEGRKGVTATVDEPEMKQPKTVKRHAEVGERIMITNAAEGYENHNGKVYTVFDTSTGDVDGVDVKELNGCDSEWDFLDDEYEVIIEDEILLQDVPIIKSPNQQRAELNQRAREFVEKWTSRNRRPDEMSSKWDGGLYLYDKHPFSKTMDLEFVVNAEKHTVVALLHRWDGVKRIGVISRGIAKCMPGDVFNADIGKAIALARALEIDIPKEFLDAVQPDSPAVGMVTYKVSGYIHGVRTIKELVDNSHPEDFPGQAFVTHEGNGQLVISQVNVIDDTNADYSDGECG